MLYLLQGYADSHWSQLKLNAFLNLVSSLEAGNAAPGGSAASKGGGASKTAFPVGDWERDNSRTQFNSDS
ncbi:MAG: hypothetical protein RMY16_06745 [Nostoc sp. DedQUE12b]|uniref:hypothetical protein n=1 Tax=Nostoc sp. DedQUE12b TaxID=3075398 RepID=UPI002AD467F1|nr:hypothetical protein [Nostoc sp. DedQUE12b]MDZ8085280.1 hypothetical protein [Nostoc sp. DedQUE12b]